jgi:hypothetical protein
MTTWQALREWKYFLEFLAGLSLVLTASFFILVMDRSNTILEGQRSTDGLMNQMEHAESQLANLEEPGLNVASTYHLENLSATYLGPLAEMRPALNKNQDRIASLITESEKIASMKSELLTNMGTMENFILNTKSTAGAEMTPADVTYLATVSAWLTNLKGALYTGNIDAKSLNRLNQLTGTMQENSNFVSELFPAQLIAALSVYMNSTQDFLYSRQGYLAMHENAMNSLVGLKGAIALASQGWMASIQKNQIVLWIACFLGMAMTAGLFFKLFSNKHFATMLAGTPEEARLIENSEFLHQVDELLNIVDRNWIDSRRESTILKDTVLVNEDMQRNIHQLEHDIKTRTSHEEGEFETVMTKIKQLRLKVQHNELSGEDITDVESAIRNMQANLILDNKSVSDDLSGVENSLFALNSDMRKLQNVMGKVIQDSRALLRMRNNIEESEKLAKTI